MKIYVAKSFLRAYKKVTKKQPSLNKKIQSKIELFRKDPKSKLLKFHKLKGRKEADWSFSIEKNLRIITIYHDDEAILVDIGSHDEVY